MVLKRRHTITAAVVIVGIALTFAVYLRRKGGRWKEVRIATATRGGTYFLLGQKLERLLEELQKNPIKKATALETQGSVHNIDLLISEKGKLLFRTDSKFSSDLDRKMIPAGLRKAFENNGIQLSDNDKIAVSIEGGKSQWLIKDKGKDNRQAYIIKLKADRLHIYKNYADIALVMKPAIDDAAAKERAKIRVLARLYSDIIQIVVRKNEGFDSLTNLNGKRIYISTDDSSRKIAEAIFKAVEVEYIEVQAANYIEAVKKLLEGDLDAAFFIAGMPTDAVKMALQTGKCNLLNLKDSLKKIRPYIDDLVDKHIAANYYKNQITPVQTVGTKAFLICRKDLDNNLVFLIEKTLFDNIDELLMVHMTAQDIRIDKAFSGLPTSVLLHPGAERFRKNEQKTLTIATGAINGKYWHIGKAIQTLLNQRGIRTRVFHTDGSLENAELLMKQPTLAIMQYDTALASHTQSPKVIFKTFLDGIDIPTVRGMKRIATLHQEKIHIIMRRKLLGEDGTPPTIDVLKGRSNLRVCLGPENSGTRVVAQAILNHSEISPKALITLPVLEMVNKIHDEEIDVGFFVGHVPSEAVKTLLDNNSIRLLSIPQKAIAKLVGQVFRKSRIEKGTYGCQLEDEPAIETITTIAVLVTTVDKPFNVKKIAETIFNGADLIGIEAAAMAEGLAIPLHRGAKAHYREAGYPGYLPPRSLFSLLSDTWRSLTIIVIVLGAYKALLELKRNRTNKQIRREIYQVRLTADSPDSVQNLLQVSDKIRGRVRRKWWQPGELDSSRWSELEGLIDTLIKEAREKMTRVLLKEIRDVGRESHLDNAMRLKRYSSLEERIWTYLENGGLDNSQHGFLMGIIQEGIEHSSDKPEGDQPPEK